MRSLKQNFQITNMMFSIFIGKNGYQPSSIKFGGYDPQAFLNNKLFILNSTDKESFKLEAWNFEFGPQKLNTTAKFVEFDTISPFIFVPRDDFEVLQRSIEAVYSASAPVICSDQTGCYFNSLCSDITQRVQFSF
jgi:hypothetical protein